MAVRISSAPVAPTTPALTVIPLPTVTATPTPAPTQAAAQTPTAQPGGIPSGASVAEGMLVEVIGTGADGLRLRAAPGLQSATNLIAVENEVFEIRDGPSEADGQSWWYLVNPYDNSKYGWGVAEYLQPAGG